jgi:hypothetical protein
MGILALRQKAEGFKEKKGKKSGFGIRHEASSGLRQKS